MRQCRRSIETHWRQLGRVTDKNDLALCSRTHECDQVVKKISCSESGGGLLLPCLYSDKRDLIHDKESFLVLVRGKGELPEAVSSYRLLTVYMLVDGISRLPCVRRQDLRCTACWGKKDTFCLVFLHHGYDGSDSCCLTGTGIPVHDKYIVLVRAHEVRHLAQETVLTRGGLMSQAGHKT